MNNLEPIFVLTGYMLYVGMALRITRKVARDKNYVGCYLIAMLSMPTGFFVIFVLTAIYKLIIGV